MFYLQNKYQDSDWESVPNVEFNYQDLAVNYAQNLSGNSISYGMVRVIDNETSKIVAVCTDGTIIYHNILAASKQK
jgi:hypothetical protein